MSKGRFRASLSAGKRRTKDRRRKEGYRFVTREQKAKISSQRERCGQIDHLQSLIFTTSPVVLAY